MFQPLERYLSIRTNWGIAGVGIDEGGCGFVRMESNNWKCCIMSSAVDRVVESYIMESLCDGTRKAWKYLNCGRKVLIKGIFWYKIYIRVPLSGGFWSGPKIFPKATCPVIYRYCFAKKFRCNLRVEFQIVIIPLLVYVPLKNISINSKIILIQSLFGGIITNFFIS